MAVKNTQIPRINEPSSYFFLKYKNIPEKLTSLLGSSAVTWVAF